MPVKQHVVKARQVAGPSDGQKNGPIFDKEPEENKGEANDKFKNTEERFWS